MQDKSHLSDQPYLSKNTKNKGLGTKKNTSETLTKGCGMYCTN